MTNDIKATGERGLFIYNKETKTFDKVKKEQNQKVHYVITDDIPQGIESMVDGKTYYSKSALRRSYKLHGVIEKGNDRSPRPKAPDPEQQYIEIREDTEKAYYDLKYDRVPLTEKEKHECEQENRQMESAQKRARARWA